MSASRRTDFNNPAVPMASVIGRRAFVARFLG